MHGGNDMPHRVPTSAPRLGLLLCDVILVIIAWLNMASMKEVAALPSEYQPKARSLSSSAANVGASRTILRIEGNEADSPELLRYYLCKYTAGDSVTVTDVSSNVVSERKIGLVAKYTSFDLGTMTVVGVIYFVFGIYVILKHSSRPFAGVLHALAVGTALMILCDWGCGNMDSAEPIPPLQFYVSERKERT
jgi:hypothetical protein